MRVTILGAGASSGTPAVGIGWGRCDPQNPRNRRTRASILVEEGTTRLLVDTSPDLRQQLLRTEVDRLDAVLFTHAHADHLHGIDDLRGVNRAMNMPIPAYLDERTLEGVRSRFGYVLAPLPEGVDTYYKPTLEPHIIAPGDNFTIGEIPVTAFEQDHGYSKTIGFRFGDIAYSTDVVDLDENAFAALAGVSTWIIGTLTDVPHHTHAHVGKALGWIERAGPRRAVLTHLGLDLDYATLAATLPKGVEPAYDGMVVAG